MIIAFSPLTYPPGPARSAHAMPNLSIREPISAHA